MGWFEDQIKQRKINDNELMEDTFINIAGAVMGKKVFTALNNDRKVTQTALDEILKFYKVKSGEVPDHITDTDEQLEYLLHPHGMMRRTVTLSPGWHKDAIGAMLAIRKEDGLIVALIPAGLMGYCYIDPKTKKRVKITSKNEVLFDEEAIAIYKPLPLNEVKVGSLLKHMLGILSLSDFVMIIIAVLAATLLGLLLPRINNIIFSDVINSNSFTLLFAVAVFLICVSISILLIGGIKSLITTRISTKISVSVSAATIIRILSLPPDFFKKYSSGELSSRTQYISSLCSILINMVFSTGLTSLFSIIYITQIFTYATALVVPSIIILLMTVTFTIISSLAQTKISKKQMEYMSKENGVAYALISGIQKIKLTGAEKRAFAIWGDIYSKEAELKYNPPLFLKINSVISMTITLIGTIVLYSSAVLSEVSVADYYAFNVAFGMVSGAFVSLAGIAQSISQINPIFELVSPILKTVPEFSEDKEVLSKLSGKIEVNNLSFKYNEKLPLVLNDVSLTVNPGQYVAIVGKTGCGKSTLLRLLLGFETPTFGSVYYDNKDIKDIDLKSLRKNIGTVMQNDKLFMADIYSNIIICAPMLSIERAWEAAELAGIAEDIKRMPMGMHTMISEGSGGISGGQKQRLIIARAIAPKPNILFFDEATSALDNITQKKVSDSLDALKCTRVVIAHRLSTIKHCDRIIVIDSGKIVEDGTYEELLKLNGHFTELVKRQMTEQI